MYMHNANINHKTRDDMKTPKSAVFNFRIPEELKQRFDAACEAQDVTGAQILRHHIVNFTESFEEYTAAKKEKK